MENNRTFTNEIHKEVIFFLLSKDQNIYEAKKKLTESEKSFINDIGGVLCDKEVESDKDLYCYLKKIADGYKDENNFLKKFLSTVITNISELRDKKDRIQRQIAIREDQNHEVKNFSRFYSISSKRNEKDFESGMKNGTLSGEKALKVIEKFDLKEKKFLDSKYTNLYLLKYDMRHKWQLAEVLNIPFVNHINKKILEFIVNVMVFCSSYLRAACFDYQNQSDLEVITSKFLKILDEEKYRDMKIRYLNDFNEKKVGVAIKLLDAENNSIQKMQNLGTDQLESFIQCLAESFILDINDRTTMYNMMFHKNKCINIDYGMKYEKKHIGVIKKFSKAIRDTKIDKAKEIFLSEIKRETRTKVCLLRIQGFFKKVDSLDDLIKERNIVYDTAKKILDDMPNEEFIKIFSDLLSNYKMGKIDAEFGEFYEKNDGYRRVHYDIPEGARLILNSINEYHDVLRGNGLSKKRN